LTVCQNGYGKRTVLDEYRLQGRGGQGLIDIKTTDRNGKAVGLLAVADADDLMLITRLGQIVRTPASQISSIGRNTQGVRCISFKSDGDSLVSFTKVPSEDA
jgi:DNA gyrase subunit A